ncbi:hypothetical protein C7S15_1366 [Burkholderia cepacia]|nr:hypothetical protein [Burkholderia cepacia]
MPGLVRGRLFARTRVVTMNRAEPEQVLGGLPFRGRAEAACVVGGIHATAVASGAR